MIFNTNTVLAMTLLTAASMGGTVVEGADTDHWTSTRLARKRRKLNNKANSPTPTPTRNLFVQVGTDCQMIEPAPGIYLFSATVGNETIAFAERPIRTASTIPTKEFMNTTQFDTMFATSNPNAAITFSTTTTNTTDSNGPLIVELSRPYFLPLKRSGRDYIEYIITQSESQSAVAPITQFPQFNVSSCPGCGSPCSIFIDAAVLYGEQEVEYFADDRN